MSLPRLFLSGILVASGLVLGVFTLHGYLAPDWLSRQTQSATVRPSAPVVINAFQGRSRFVSSRVRQAEAGYPIVKVRTHAAPAADSRPDAKPAAKNVPRKKLAEKAKRPQQASVQWPWNLFNNN
jgi:hypothetical protein